MRRSSRRWPTPGSASQAIDGVAAAAGPGLIGGLIVGVTTAKAIALGLGKPFIAVNHLEAHALSAGLTDGLGLSLSAAAGVRRAYPAPHRQGGRRYERLGTTLDDALGEAFDKAAKLLGLGYPGGPEVERHAARGQATIKLPRPMLGRPEPHFSLAGLKTALRHEALKRGRRSSEQAIADLCASFQEAVADVVSDRTARAMEIYEERLGPEAQRALVVAGGVAANQRLKRALEEVRRRARLPPRGAAAGALHRQCRHDRLGGRRCGWRAGSSTIWPRRPAPAGRSIRTRRPRLAPASRLRVDPRTSLETAL